MEWLWIALGVVGVVVLFSVLGKSMRPTVPPTRTTTATTAFDPSVGSEIDRLVAEGNKIQAIKLLRDSTPGLGLQEAKNRIDAWPTAAPATTSAIAVAASTLSPGAIAEIDALVAADRKIEAIKLLRVHTGWGLKESKERIDAWGGATR
ncbi:MAG TPA: ribosomal protein L7/L12 [Microbacterium sp.]|nr:ribosomal protein L7/L12 [Microbacterium sp.]